MNDLYSIYSKIIERQYEQPIDYYQRSKYNIIKALRS